MKKQLAIFSLFFGLLLFSGVNAEENMEQSDPAPNMDDCFSYYKFQSVLVNVASDKNVYLPEEIIKFEGELTNENTYPITDGYVFVRIGRKNPNAFYEGNDIKDEFIALEEVSLAEGETKPVTLEWQVPANFTAGDYQADYFFSVGKKFNLGGLPFSNEVVSSSSSFQIHSKNKAQVSLDKAQTTINDNPYSQIGPAPQFAPEENIKISQILNNSFDEDRSVDVTYDLYWWDSLNEEDQIKTSQETITVPANQSQTLKYEVPAIDDSVYYLKITARAGDQQSIINIRFAAALNHPRLNYPAITKFPLQKGDQFTLFSCFHETSFAEPQEGKVIVVLSDQKNKELGRAEYQGQIMGDMSLVKQELTADNNYSWLKLKAQVFNAKNEVIDEYETIYDCGELNSAQCQNIASAPVDTTGTNQAVRIFFLIVIALILIVVIILIRKQGKNNGSSSKLGGLLAFLALNLGLVIALNPSTAGAANITSNRTSFTIAENNMGATIIRHNEGYLRLERINISGSAQLIVSLGRQGTTITDEAVNKISLQKGETVDIYFTFRDPYYTFTGYLSDTPYGRWCRTKAECENTHDFVWMRDNAFVLGSSWYQRQMSPFYAGNGWTNIGKGNSVSQRSYRYNPLFFVRLQGPSRLDFTDLNQAQGLLRCDDQRTALANGFKLSCTAVKAGSTTLRATLRDINAYGIVIGGPDISDQAEPPGTWWWENVMRDESIILSPAGSHASDAQISIAAEITENVPRCNLSYHEKTFTTKAAIENIPSENLCQDPTDFTPKSLLFSSATDTWTWQCKNSKGTADCRAFYEPAAVDGQCGSFNNRTYLNLTDINCPTSPASGFCAKGTFIRSSCTNATASKLTWNWACAGEYGGKSATCQAQYQPPIECGSANGATIENQPPAISLCKSPATASNFLNRSEGGAVVGWTWDCTLGSDTAHCEAFKAAPTIPNPGGEPDNSASWWQRNPDLED